MTFKIQIKGLCRLDVSLCYFMTWMHIIGHQVTLSTLCTVVNLILFFLLSMSCSRVPASCCVPGECHTSSFLTMKCSHGYAGCPGPLLSFGIRPSMTGCRVIIWHPVIILIKCYYRYSEDNWVFSVTPCPTRAHRPQHTITNTHNRHIDNNCSAHEIKVETSGRRHQEVNGGGLKTTFRFISVLRLKAATAARVENLIEVLRKSCVCLACQHWVQSVF